MDGVARFCLGRFWRNATPDQQKQYIALFHDVLLNNISGKLGEYQGVTFTMGRTQSREDTQVVSTTVERPNNPPTNVDWIISEASGSPKIVDVVAEGTSLRLTQRSDYAAYLARNNNNVAVLLIDGHAASRASALVTALRADPAEVAARTSGNPAPWRLSPAFVERPSSP